MNTRLDELGLGVKSQSNPAIAGSCRNISRYSLSYLVKGVELQIGGAGHFATAPFLTPNTLTVERECELGGKLLVQELNNAEFG